MAAPSPWSTPLAEPRSRAALAEAALFGVLGGLTFAMKLALAALPNIEPVSLMVMLFAVTFGRRALYPIYVYVLLEILVYGAGLWNIYYLYIWLILAAGAWLLRRETHPLSWALLSGGFGLLFGLLCAPVDAAIGGWGYALAHWVSGIPFDLLHCAGNFAIALALFPPLRRLFTRLYEMTPAVNHERKKGLDNMAKKILKAVGIILAVVLLAAAGLVGWLTLREYRPAAVEDVEVNRTGAPKTVFLAPGDSLTVLSQNTGYAGLGAGSDFFMDGGDDVAPTREQMDANLAGLSSLMNERKADVFFLQEVDTNSGRTGSVDQGKIYWDQLLADGKGSYSSSHTLNYSCDFVPFPWPPIGKVHSGLQTLSRLHVDRAERIALPCPFSWPVSTANLKRCLLVSYVPLEGTDKELVLVNLHLEAYDDGEGKAAQTKMLVDFLTAEYEKGNYVIAGGDFNQTFPGALDAFPIQDPSLWTPGVLETDTLPGGWQFVCDLSTPSCRLLNHPYEPDPAGNQFYVIDGFILSPNVALDSVETLDRQFTYADHNPVAVSVTLKTGE